MSFYKLFGQTVSPEMLRSKSALKMWELVTSGRLDDVHFLECRTNKAGDFEAIVVKIVVPLGQKPTIEDIRAIEPFAIVFQQVTSLPIAIPLREDFPTNIPHLNIAPKDHPQSLCLSDQPLDDQIRSYTAIRFLTQVKWWLERTAYGKLHGDEQPLDPLFHASPDNVIATENLDDADYVVGMRCSLHENAPVALVPLSDDDFRHALRSSQSGLLTPLFIQTDAVAHGQLHWMPKNLEELIYVYDENGVDLKAALSSAIGSLVEKPQKNELMAQSALIVVKTEIRSPDARTRIQSKAFISNSSVGSIGEALGIIANVDNDWAKLISAKQTAHRELSQISIASADIHPHFSRNRALECSGYEKEDHRSIVLVGAGAIGSHVAMNIARGGIGTWHIVDDDFLLPHNLARHVLEPDHVGHAKSEALSLVINRLIGRDSAHSYFSRVGGFDRPESITSAFRSTSAVLDASASVPAARILAFDEDISAPVFSFFVNPQGTDGILLSEPQDRSIRIDCIEMHYYWIVSSVKSLASHLSTTPGQPLPVGGCRSPSVRIPETRISLLAALMAGRWLKESNRKAASISVWQSLEDFEAVNFNRFDVPKFEVVSLGKWTIKVSEQVIDRASELRRTAGPKETGGIIAGSWDRLNNIVYLVGIYDPPPNSVRSETGFIRGSVGVYKSIQDLENTTLGNLTYVGEWHSHPTNVKSSPSNDDENLLLWIGDILSDVEAPAIMLIAGEDGCRIISFEDDEYQSTVLTSN